MAINYQPEDQINLSPVRMSEDVAHLMNMVFFRITENLSNFKNSKKAVSGENVFLQFATISSHELNLMVPKFNAI